MTKYVRIENADSGTLYKPVVQIWDKGYVRDDSGQWVESGEDKLVDEIVLHNPCQLEQCYITSSRYLVIKELETK